MQPSSYYLYDHDRLADDAEAREIPEQNDDSIDTREPNWAAVVLVGIILIVIGLASLDASGGASAAFVFLGAIMVIGGSAYKKWNPEFDPTPSQYDEWPEDYQIGEIDEYPQYGRQLNQQQIDEIVKAVKSTIKVRCRYCGTLNEEKAASCESCGAPL